MQIADSFASVLGLTRTPLPLAEGEQDVPTFEATFKVLASFGLPEPTKEMGTGDIPKQIFDSSPQGLETGLGPGSAQPPEGAPLPKMLAETGNSTAPVFTAAPLVPRPPTTEGPIGYDGSRPVRRQIETVAPLTGAIDQETTPETRPNDPKVDLAAPKIPAEIEGRTLQPGAPTPGASGAGEQINGSLTAEKIEPAIAIKAEASPPPLSPPTEPPASRTNAPVTETKTPPNKRPIEALATELRSIEPTVDTPRGTAEVDRVSRETDKIQSMTMQASGQDKRPVKYAEPQVTAIRPENEEPAINEPRAIQPEVVNAAQTAGRPPPQTSEAPPRAGPDQVAAQPKTNAEAQGLTTASKDIALSISPHGKDTPQQTIVHHPPAATKPPPDLVQIDKIVHDRDPVRQQRLERPQEATGPIQIEGSVKGPVHISEFALLEAKPEILPGKNTPIGFNGDEGVEKPSSSQETHVKTIDTVKDIAGQIKDATQSKDRSHIEIRLNPEELGKVRISLSPHDAGGAVSIVVERPETFDLMRRHIDQLLREFKSSGWADVDLSMSRQDTGTSERGGQQNSSKFRDSPLQEPSNQSETAILTSPDASLPRNGPIITDRLDLRI